MRLLGPLFLFTALSLPSITLAQLDYSFKGSGHIEVLLSEGNFKATPSNRIGCLDARGQLTVSDCAIFTRSKEYPHPFMSPEGNCTFKNPAMPKNGDSYYGRDSLAWSCWDHPVKEGTTEWYYTIDGFNYPFICHDNLYCYYDIPAVPSKEASSTVPVWEFFWGGQQMGPPPGHFMALWLWVPVNVTEGAA